MNILVIGLGNPILGDDGIGWRVVEQAQQLSDLPKAVEFDCLAVGGISLMERMIGYDQVILVDAIVTNQHPLGSVLCFPLEELPNRALGHMSSSHDTTLQTALQVGKSMGARLPEQITLVAVESQNVYDFSEDLTEPVAAAVPEAVQLVMDLLAGSSLK